MLLFHVVNTEPIWLNLKSRSIENEISMFPAFNRKLKIIVKVTLELDIHYSR